MRKQSFRLLCMLLALVMTFSMVLTGAPMHVHAAEDIVVTVGASGCDYTTINAALDAIAAMSRSSGQRAVIEIQPGNYEEMLYIELDNITLRNASSNPSIALTNKGVDIDANAVRITHYYGHGYNYYSMDSNYRYSDSVLASNKSKGSASTTNPGAGSSTHWNATVVIAGNNFIAEDIIFENSFNQYISQKSKNDTIVKASGAKEGSTPRVNLPVGSTAVQDKTYVERAAALAIKNKAQNAFFDHCKFVGRQDTLYGGRPVTAAFYDCEIYGACDYIFGGMTAVFAKCDLVFNTSDHKDDKGYITASQTQSGSRGMLFYNCHITSTTPGVDTASAYASKPGYLGRPWAENTGEAIFYYTVIDATCSNWSSQSKSLIQPVGWLDTLGGESKLSGEYGTVELSGVNNSSSRESWATGVNSSGKLLDGSTISVSTFLGSWNPFSGKDMTIVTDGTVIEPEVTTPDATTAPENTTTGSSGGMVTAGSYIHNFTDDGFTSTFFTIAGGQVTNGKHGTFTHDFGNGTETLNYALKFDSGGSVTFKPTANGTITIAVAAENSGRSVVINDGTTDIGTVSIDTAKQLFVLTKDVTANVTYTVKRSSGESGLYYIAYTPEGSSSGEGGSEGGEGGGTEETVTATGTLNMSSVTVTKAAGAADPTTVNASLLSGLVMTVSYSDGTSASIALSDLVISNIKSHDTLGKYIDVDYNDPVTGTKVHCYILVTIQEESGSEGGGESGGTVAGGTYVLDATKDLTAFAAGGKADGDTEVIHDFFTIHYSSKTKVDSSNKTFEDGYSATQRLNFSATTNASNMYNSVEFTTGAAATVTVWWVSGGDGRTMAIYDSTGAVLLSDGDASVKNSLYISTFELDTAGTYYLGVPKGSNYLFKLEVAVSESGSGESHTHSYTEEITTAATCTTAGVKTFTCSCGEGTYTEAIPALGHTAGAAATCTTAQTCTVCNATITAALGHTEVTDAAVAATCTETGKTEGKHCSVCGTVTVAQTTVAALGHTNAAAVKESEKPATCGADGSYESVVYCSVCNAEVSRDTITVPATGAHVYATESQRVAATCTADGYVIMACGCGATQTTILTATGHTEVTDAAVTATCTETGKTEGKHCSVCGTVTVAQTTVAALGHKEKVVVGEAATCTETGLTDGKICERCGETLEAQKEIPALGHTNATAVKENEKAATCTVDGSYDSVVYCSVCEAEISREKVTVKANGHDEVIDKAVAASCTAPGKTEGKHCSVCNEVTVAQTEVEALGHAYKDGTCTRCGAADPTFVPGVTVSGTYKSFKDASDVLTIELFIEGQDNAAYSFNNEAAPANSSTWSIEGVAPGTYTVKVSKANHVSREYKLTVAEENVTDMNVEIWLLGDMNGDGLANGVDYGNVLRQVKFADQPILTDYNRQCSDTDGNGLINFWDYLSILMHMKGTKPLW